MNSITGKTFELSRDKAAELAHQVTGSWWPVRLWAISRLFYVFQPFWNEHIIYLAVPSSLWDLGP